jgi:hypothetical protein
MANLATSFADESMVGKPADDSALRALLAQSVRRSGRSREQIADDLARALGREITVHMLNGWIAPGREGARMPASFVRTFCAVTGDDTIQRFLLGNHLSKLLKLGEVVARVLPDSLVAIKHLPPAESIPEEPQELPASK